MSSGLPLFIPVILGTTRKGRYSEYVASFVLEQMRLRRDVETELIDIRELRLAPDDAGEALKQPGFSATMMRADALVLVVPEYNHGYPQGTDFKLTHKKLRPQNPDLRSVDVPTVATTSNRSRIHICTDGIQIEALSAGLVNAEHRSRGLIRKLPGASQSKRRTKLILGIAGRPILVGDLGYRVSQTQSGIIEHNRVKVRWKLLLSCIRLINDH